MGGGGQCILNVATPGQSETLLQGFSHVGLHLCGGNMYLLLCFVCVCVCVCVCVGMFMWFMRTHICIMTWV